VSSEVFDVAKAPEGVAAESTALAGGLPIWVWAVAAATVLTLVVGMAFALKAKKARPSEQTLLTVGARVGDLEAGMASAANVASARVVDRVSLPGKEAPALPDVAVATRERARELTQADPTKALYLLRAWIAADADPVEAKNG
jgi:hypothetical protein